MATCTVQSRENVNWSRPSWRAHRQLEPAFEFKLWPTPGGGDGFLRRVAPRPGLKLKALASRCGGGAVGAKHRRVVAVGGVPGGGAGAGAGWLAGAGKQEFGAEQEATALGRGASVARPVWAPPVGLALDGFGMGARGSPEWVPELFLGLEVKRGSKLDVGSGPILLHGLAASRAGAGPGVGAAAFLRGGFVLALKACPVSTGPWAGTAVRADPFAITRNVPPQAAAAAHRCRSWRSGCCPSPGQNAVVSWGIAPMNAGRHGRPGGAGSCRPKACRSNAASTGGHQSPPLQASRPIASAMSLSTTPPARSDCRRLLQSSSPSGAADLLERGGCRNTRG